MNKQIKHYNDKLRYEIDSADLAGFFLAESLPQNILVLDTRSPEAYDREHIPGAVSFPHRTMNEDSTKSLDREALYVTYCDGIGCNASTKGALKMAELGFMVKELMGGIDWWKRDCYSTEGEQGKKRTIEVHCAC